MGRDKATKVVRKKGRSPLIFQFQMRCTHFSPTMQIPGIRFFRGGGVGWGGVILRNFRLNFAGP